MTRSGLDLHKVFIIQFWCDHSLNSKEQSSEVLAFKFLLSNLNFSSGTTQLHFPMSLVPEYTMSIEAPPQHYQLI